MIKFSVIIPVFNAERFIERAVNSAVMQEEVCDVVIVEDGSTDRTLEICQGLVERHSNVRLVAHLDKRNKGAGASRNLGVHAADSKWLSFLDADDFFLPGRFRHVVEMVQEDCGCEALVDAVGTHFDDEIARERWYEDDRALLTTLRGSIGRGSLRLGPLAADAEVRGSIHPAGLVATKDALTRANLFPEELRLHQDTALLYKLLMAADVCPGILDRPVAMRGVHKGNRITRKTSRREAYERRLSMWANIWGWANAEIADEEKKACLLTSYKKGVLGFARPKGALSSKAVFLIRLAKMYLLNPELFVPRWRLPPVDRLRGF